MKKQATVFILFCLSRGKNIVSIQIMIYFVNMNGKWSTTCILDLCDIFIDQQTCQYGTWSAVAFVSQYIELRHILNSCLSIFLQPITIFLRLLLQKFIFQNPVFYIQPVFGWLIAFLTLKVLYRLSLFYGFEKFLLIRHVYMKRKWCRWYLGHRLKSKMHKVLINILGSRTILAPSKLI